MRFQVVVLLSSFWDYNLQTHLHCCLHPNILFIKYVRRLYMTSHWSVCRYFKLLVPVTNTVNQDYICMWSFSRDSLNTEFNYIMCICFIRCVIFKLVIIKHLIELHDYFERIIFVMYCALEMVFILRFS